MDGRRLGATLSAVLLVGLGPVYAQSQPVIRLTIADGFAADHYVNSLLASPLVTEIAGASHGRLAATLNPKDAHGNGGEPMLAAIKNGSVSIGLLFPDLMPARMPLLRLAEYPGWTKSTCDQVRTLMELTRPGGALARSDLEPNGLHAVLVLVMPDYQLLTTKRTALRGAKPMLGLRLRTTTDAGDEVVRGLGGAPMRLTAGKMADEIRARNIDGALTTYRSALDNDLDGVLPFGSSGVSFGAVVQVYAMSQSGWNALNADDQTALNRAAAAVAQSSCRNVDAEMAAATDEAALGGTCIHFLEGRDRRRLIRAFQRIRRSAALALDTRGLDGSRVMAALDGEDVRPPAKLALHRVQSLKRR